MKYLSANKFIISALLLCISASLFVFIISIRQTEKVKNTTKEALYAKVVLDNLDAITIASLKLQSETRGYLITGETKFLEHIKAIHNRYEVFAEKSAEIRSFSEENNSAEKQLEDNIKKAITFSDSIVTLKQHGDITEAVAKIASDRGNKYIENILTYSSLIKISEQNKQNIIISKNQKEIYKLNTILYAGLIIVVLLGVFLFTKVRDEFNAHRIGEEKFKSILELAPDATVLTTNAGQIKLVNLQTEKLIGYTKQELEKLKLINLVTNESHIQLEYLLNQTSNNNTGQLKMPPVEIEILCKNKMILQAEITGSPISFNGEAFTYVSLRDVSVRKAEQQEMRNLFTQINQASEAIYVVDEDYLIKSWNKGAESLYGFSKEEAIGQNSMKLLKTNIAKNELTLIQQQIIEKGFWSGEIKRTNKQGTEMDVYTSLSEVKDSNDRKKNYVSVSFDISQRKKLEGQVNHLVNIVEQSSEAIISTGCNNKIISWNSGAEKMLGYHKNEAIGKSIYDIKIFKQTENEISELFNDITQKENLSFEKEYYHKNGQVITGAVSANTIKDEKGKATGLVFIIKDVTLWKQLQNKLEKYNDELEEKIKERTEDIKRSEEKYKLLYYNNPLPMWVYDVETYKLLGVNNAAEILYGYTREEFLDLTLLDIRPKEDIDAFLCIDHSHSRKDNNLYRGIWRHLKKDKTQIHVEIFNHPIIYEGVKARLTLINDVTDRLKSESKLVASEKKFRALIENSYDIITMLDKDFNVLYRSPSAKRVTGRENEDVIGIDGRKKIHPDDISQISTGIKRLLSKPGNVEECIFRYQHKDGHYLWLEGNATNLLHDEYVKAIIFNYRDVTERMNATRQLKISEARYRSAFDNMIEGVQIIGFDWKYKYVNNTVVKQAHSKKEELLGFTMMEKFPGIEKTELFKIMQDCFFNRKPVLFENKFIFPDNSVAWFELSIQPVQEGIFILSVDITDKVEAAAALKEERDKLSSIAITSPGLIYSFRMTEQGEVSFPFASNAAEDIFGYSTEILENNIGAILENSLLHDKELVRDSIIKSASTMTPWQLEFRYTHPVKGLRWLEGNSLPLKETDGSILWHGIIMDITDRKKAEEKITEKNAQLETLSNNLPGIMIYQLSGDNYQNRQFTYVSKEVTRLTGKRPDEVIADPSLLYNLIYEEDIPRLLNSELNSYKNFTTFNEEVRCKDANGDIRWLNIISTPRITNEGKTVWDGFHIDITDRKKNEEAIHTSYTEKRMIAEKLTTILNTLPANIALLDENGIIVDVNQSWIKFAVKNRGYGDNYGIGESYISLTEKTVFFDYTISDKQRIASGIKNVLSKSAKKFVYECHSKDKKYWFRKIVSPLSGMGYTGAVVMHIDISQIHLLEEERLRIKTEEQKNITAAILQGQEKERNAIAKELHDNINQILAGINMLLGLIAKKHEKAKELLPLCIENINLAIKETRKMAHELVSPDTYAENLVEQVKNIAKTILQNAGIHTRVYCKNFDESLLSDKQRLTAYRIVQEQCNNILKYAAAKNVVLLLHTSATNFLLIIKDNGNGMDINKRSDGIGIQNIKNRVSVFNGSVSIATKPGGGFKLSIEIPLQANTVSHKI